MVSPNGPIQHNRSTGYGKFEATGELTASVQLRLPEGATSRLRLTVNGKAQEATVAGKDKNEIVTAAFGTFSIGVVGYQRFQLESLNDTGEPFGEIDAMVLDGPATEGVDRKKVAAENRVQLLGKGEGVYSGDFGNEGTGGHSHLKYLWKTGEKQRFLVTALPADGTHTDFSGYWFHPEQMKWMLISSWRGPKEGGQLRGLHGFSENFSGNNGHLQRKALYGNQWIRTPNGDWIELTTAKFSHDPTGKTDRFDRFMGVEHGEFFLSHGGFVNGYCEYGTPLEREATNRPLQDMELPRILN